MFASSSKDEVNKVKNQLSIDRMGESNGSDLVGFKILFKFRF